jgi:hypothetical protein
VGLGRQHEGAAGVVDVYYYSEDEVAPIADAARRRVDVKLRALRPGQENLPFHADLGGVGSAASTPVWGDSGSSSSSVSL